MKILAATLALLLAGTTASAQDHNHSAGMTHSPAQHAAPGAAKAAGMAAHVAAGEGKLTETGQATFAAIQEAVAILEADPKTDRSKVNIETLRRHLVDMENVMTMANIETVPVPNGARFVVTGTGSVIPSIQKMIAGHAMTMDGSDDWKYTPARLRTAAPWRSPQPARPML